MSAVLMDTNALVWLLNGDQMTTEALFAIASAQPTHRLYVSPISAWEAGLAIRKRVARPDLGGSARSWFRSVLAIPGVRLVPPLRRISLEATNVPDVYGSGDPGDCFLIATARVKGVPIVTRDRAMLELAASKPDYLQAIGC